MRIDGQAARELSDSAGTGDRSAGLDVPPEHLRAAEEIRAHLVAVRGGAPFLSSADARLLVQWLDEGVSVAGVLQAIERAADARRKRRSRLPLTLTRAKAHLGKAPLLAHEPANTTSNSHPFAGVGARLTARGEASLAERLVAIVAIDPEERLRQALALVRPFLHARWDALPKAERDARVRSACDELATLDLAEDEREVLAEEIVRDEIRGEWPMLDAASLFALAHGGSR